MFLAFYLLWTLLPIFVMFVSSFKDLLEAFKLPAVGDWGGVTLFFDFSPTFKHYHNLFADLNFTIYFFNSIAASLGSALISVVLGSMCAYALSRIDFRGKKDLFFWIISTRMAPVVAVMVPLYAIFRSAGLVGTLPGLILAYTTFNLPVRDLDPQGLLRQRALRDRGGRRCATAPPASRRSARSCRWWRPGIGAFLVLCMLFAWNDFLFASIIGSGGAKTLPVATKELVQPQNIQWGSIMAAGVVTTLPMMFLGLLIRRYLVTGLTMGAVQGIG